MGLPGLSGLCFANGETSERNFRNATYDARSTGPGHGSCAVARRLAWARLRGPMRAFDGEGPRESV